jgi:hypothetical protein
MDPSARKPAPDDLDPMPDPDYDDEDTEGRSETEQLVDRGVERAEDDQVRGAAREARAGDAVSDDDEHPKAP